MATIGVHVHSGKGFAVEFIGDHLARGVQRRARCVRGRRTFGVPASTLVAQVLQPHRLADGFRQYRGIHGAIVRIVAAVGAGPGRPDHSHFVERNIERECESFIDEVAAAVGADPVEFRLRHIKEPRDVAVIKAAAEKAKWDTRPSPRRDQTGDKVSGRGIAYAQRNGTRVAVIAEVDINRSTGKIWARKFTVAHDCGQIINPDGLVKCIEGNVVQGVSRTLWEEVTFDNKTVTSVDWLSYPILDIAETPGQVDVVLINHPDLPPTGAGEPSIRPVAAAIANAIFDATGVRIRRVPFSPDRVKQALS